MLSTGGLLDLINNIGDLADAQDTVKSAGFGALNAMVRYAENHFRTEEGYLERYSYLVSTAKGTT